MTAFAPTCKTSIAVHPAARSFFLHLNRPSAGPPQKLILSMKRLAMIAGISLCAAAAPAAEPFHKVLTSARSGIHEIGRAHV